MSSAAPRSEPAGGRMRWRRLAESPVPRAGLVVLAVVVGYRYSLGSLLGTLGTNTPLAYLGLAPLIALGIALFLGRPARPDSDVRDPHIDYLVGLPLMGTALLVAVVLPARTSILFWYYRVDLLSLPLFVAGVVALLFGAATLWRIRYAVGFLLLAWPVPYTYALSHGMTGFSNVTLAALRALVRVFPVATPLASGDGSLFAVHHGAVFFTLSVASACTGVDSFVGFAMVGLAVLAVVDGTRLAKSIWLLSGIVLVYALNLTRLLLIFWTGSQLGEKAALDGLHPFLGLVLFGVGVAAMVMGLGRFRLRVRPSPTVGPSSADPGRHAVPRVAAVWRLPVSYLRGSLAIVVCSTLVLTMADGGFGRYRPVADQLGAPRLVAFTDAPISAPGWTVAPVDHYGWATEYYGSGAVWTRYLYSPLEGAGQSTVLADVINTSDLSAFSTYDVISCYDYHGYGVSDIQSIGLPDGVEGTELTFAVPSLSGQWNALYWIWPVQAGTTVHYERIVLLSPVDGTYLASSITGRPPAAARSSVLARQSSRAFLTSFARELVELRTSDNNGGTA